jgi:hypothetical protein
MAHPPPLDWHHFPHYAALFAGSVTLFCLEFWHRRREYRRKAGLVRSALLGTRCARCGGSLDEWDGRFHPGDVHFNPGSYLPKIATRCARCDAEQVFYVNWEGRLFNREDVFPARDPGGRDG